MRTSSIGLVLLLAACGPSGAPEQRAAILEHDAPRVREIVRRDVDRLQDGVREAAERLADDFALADQTRRVTALRASLRRIQQPPRGVEGLTGVPISFVAAVDRAGVVFVRDTDAGRDRMTGMNLARISPAVRRAVEDGRYGYGLTEIPNRIADGAPSVTVLFAAPVVHEGERRGAVVAGMPLWMVSRQLSRQIQLDNTAARQAGALFWTAILRGDPEDPHIATDFPQDLLEMLPSPERFRAQLSERPNGYTADAQQFGYWYAYLVLPLPTLGEEVVAVIYRR